MSITFTTVPAKRLSESITGASTSFKVNNIRGWNASDLTSADFGTRLWAVFRNSAGTLMEIMEIDPSTITSASSPITIITRGLKFNGDQSTSVAANKLTWVKGDTVVELGTHVPQLFEETVRKSGAQTIDDVKTFSSFPKKSGSTTPTSADEFVTKAYADAGFTGSATYDQNLFTGTAGETLASGDICYFKASDQRWWKAKADASATSLGVKIGVAQAAATAGNSIVMLGAGLAKNLSGLTAGLNYYLSSATGGALTTTAGTFARFIGRAVSTTVLHFSPSSGYEVMQDGSQVYAVDSVGTDAYAITLVPAITAYQDGMTIRFKAGTANTGGATLNINGIGAAAIVKLFNTALDDNDIVANQIVQVSYNSTNSNFQMTSPISNTVADLSSSIFGDGSDGSATISGNTTLTSDKYYINLTINNGITLNTGGFRIFVNGTLTNNGTIANNGGNASGTTAGTAGAAGTLGGGGAGASGVSQSSGAGGGGGGVVWISAKTVAVQGTITATGGNGGNGTAGTGNGVISGASGGTIGVSNMNTKNISIMSVFIDTLNMQTLSGGAGGASGSGNGAGTAGTSITRTLIQTGTGGNSGNCAGTNTGTGGGGGGQGGVIYFRYKTLTTSGTLTVTGGNAGTGAGTGGNGTAGSSGISIQYQVV